MDRGEMSDKRLDAAISASIVFHSESVQCDVE
jgi:hypothetical protein